MADWMSFSAQRKLTIVNPGIAACPDKIKHLAGQVECKPIGAADYFIQLNENKPSMLQSTLRKVRSIARDKIKCELTENS
jgi:hypothetical protein